MCRPLTRNHKLVQAKVAVRSRPERRGDLFASLDLSRELLGQEPKTLLKSKDETTAGGFRAGFWGVARRQRRAPLKVSLTEAARQASWSAKLRQPWDKGRNALRRLSCPGHDQSQEDLALNLIGFREPGYQVGEGNQPCAACVAELGRDAPNPKPAALQ